MTLLLACNLCIVVADISHQERAVISPPLDTTSDKVFDKDYPLDKRPKVDVFHFRHPYPAVQDSDDFDTDFVKDENSDNGSYKAQMDYDRLRHKLLKEKADLAKALKAKETAEKELEDAMKREKAQHEKVENMKVQKEKEEKEEVEKKKSKKQGTVSGSKGQAEDKVPLKKIAPAKKSGRWSQRLWSCEGGSWRPSEGNGHFGRVQETACRGTRQVGQVAEGA